MSDGTLRRSTFARVSTEILNHKKFAALDPAAIGLWTMGNVYCWDQLTDGVIPKAQVARLIAASPKRAYLLAEKLVEVGLWERRGDNFRVHDWLEWNPPASKVLAERQAARDRMRTRRRSGEHTGERSSERSGERAGHVHDRDAEADVDTPPSPSPNARTNGRYDWPSPEVRLASLQPDGTRWSPGRWPYEAFHHDCAEPVWRGRCVTAAWVEAHQGDFPVTTAGAPKQCPAHVAAIHVDDDGKAACT